jgi:alpha-N-arabinofuranosidase
MSEWVEYMTFKGVSPMADMRKENGHEEPWTVDYFGVGNENWGCGGNMRPAHYADEYRRYQTYVRNYAGNTPIKKICCGPNVDDYDWTKGVMDGLSLHYYTLPETEDDWMIKGSATEFTEEIFYQTLKRGYFMEELINNHGAIMDQYDPEKKIGLIVDEWGIWTDVEPGTNPGFLYQQNTMRDALVAGMTLNIFNKHSDRVKMACIAQLINVLQSVMLTDGEKMIKTPTYHVFHMYRHHQGATLLSSEILGAGTVGAGKNELPKVIESASVDKDGIITVTLTNNSLEAGESVDIQLATEGGSYKVSEAKVVTGTMAAHNTFENGNVVDEKDFTAFEKTDKGVKVELPACSVVSIRLQK